MKFRYILIPLLVLLFTACGNRPEDDRPTLVVSIEPLRYVVEAVAGDGYRVTTLMPVGASPETFEPTPRHMIEMSDCKTVFKSGTLPFEQQLMKQMAKNMADVPVADLGSGIEPLVDLTNHHHGTDGFDPHVWMQPMNLSLMAEKACEVLCRLDSVNRPEYEKRLAVFQTEMDSLDAELKRTLAPVKHRSFLIYHPALGQSFIKILMQDLTLIQLWHLKSLEHSHSAKFSQRALILHHLLKNTE